MTQNRVITQWFVAGTLGFAIGFMVGSWSRASPISVVAQAALPNPVTGQLLFAGALDASSAKAQTIKGSVSVFEHAIHLGKDFEIPAAAGYKLYLFSNSDIPTKMELVNNSVELGPLKSIRDSQSYLLGNIDVRKYRSLLILSSDGAVAAFARLETQSR